MSSVNVQSARLPNGAARLNISHVDVVLVVEHVVGWTPIPLVNRGSGTSTRLDPLDSFETVNLVDRGPVRSGLGNHPVDNSLERLLVFRIGHEARRSHEFLGTLRRTKSPGEGLGLILVRVFEDARAWTNRIARLVPRQSAVRAEGETR